MERRGGPRRTRATAGTTADSGSQPTSEWMDALHGLPNATLIDIIAALVEVLSAVEGSPEGLSNALAQVRRAAQQPASEGLSSALAQVRNLSPSQDPASRSWPGSPLAPTVAKAVALASPMRTATSATQTPSAMRHFIRPQGSVTSYLPPTMPRQVAASEARRDLQQRLESRLARASRSRSRSRRARS